MQALICCLVSICAIAQALPLQTTQNTTTTATSAISTEQSKANDPLNKEDLAQLLGAAYTSPSVDSDEIADDNKQLNAVPATVKTDYLQTPILITIPINIYLHAGQAPVLKTQTKATQAFLTPTADYNRLPLAEDAVDLLLPLQRQTNRHRSAGNKNQEAITSLA